MTYEVRKFDKEDWPPLLGEVNDAPKRLYIAGKVPDYNNKFLCIVGSRKYTSYGKEACEFLISGLRGYPITIVSGLALGIDSISHRAALANKLTTIAIPGSGLHQSALHPQSGRELAEQIVEAGGTLISELEPRVKAMQWNFPMRNRIMAGISHAILVVEAEIKSGTLITSRLATDYNREVLVIPNNIFAPTGEGPNMLLRLGAHPIRTAEDILNVLGIKAREEDGIKTLRDYSDCSKEEKKIISIMNEPLLKDEIVRRSAMPASQVQSLLTLLELKGYTKESLGEIRLV